MPMTESTLAAAIANRRTLARHCEKRPPKPHVSTAERNRVSILAWWDAFYQTRPGSVEAERMLCEMRGDAR